MTGIKSIFVIFCIILTTNFAGAAPTAMIAIDFETNEVLLENKSNVRLHPASLTKLMTLYVAIQAIEKSEVTLDEPIIVLNKASWVIGAEVKLKEGMEIALRHLIRAAGV